MTIQGLVSAIFFAAGLAGASAHAGVIGVKDIRVKPAGPELILQVAEFQAFETGTGVNLALAANGAVATSLNVYSWMSTPDKAIDGQYADLSYPNMFHSLTGPDEWLNISLAQASNLSSVTLYGRSDCCNVRDVFDLYFYGVDGKLLYTHLGASAYNDGHVVSITLAQEAEVPEPASLALLGMGMGVAGLALRRRRAAR